MAAGSQSWQIYINLTSVSVDCRSKVEQAEKTHTDRENMQTPHKKVSIEERDAKHIQDLNDLLSIFFSLSLLFG